MSMEDTISQIIQKRQFRLEAIGRSKESTLETAAALESLQEIKDSIDTTYSTIAAMNPGLKPALDALDIRESIRLYKKAYRQYADLYTRFSRDKINLSVIGNERNGKSTFLQKISGLDDLCIPALSEGRCTGCRSIIQNTDQDGVTADIIFKSTDSMLALVNSYLRFITDGRMQISSLKEIPGITMQKLEDLRNLAYTGQALKEDAKTDPATEAMTYLNTLYHDYICTYGEWSPYIQDTPKREYCTDENEINQYVARYDSNGQTHYRFIAVEIAIIKKRFLQSGSEKIQLVDTVGLGDLCLDTEKNMAEAVRRESDAVVFLHMPANVPAVVGVQKPILDLIGKLSLEFRQKKMNLWMTCLVNKQSGQPNQVNNCIAFKNQLEKILGADFPFASCEIVDVKKEAEVRDFVLEFLDFLLMHMDEIDGIYINDAKKAREEADQSLRMASEKFMNIISLSRQNPMNQRIIHVLRQLKTDLSQMQMEAQKTYDEVKEDQLVKVGKLEEEIGPILSEYNFAPAGDRDPVSMTLFKIWRKIRNIAVSSDDLILQKEREFKSSIAQIINHALPLGIDPEDKRYFSKMSRLLFGEDPAYGDIRESFAFMDNFSLNSITGVVNLLFSHYAYEQFNAANIRVLAMEEFDAEELDTQEFGPIDGTDPQPILGDPEAMAKRIKKRLNNFCASVANSTFYQTAFTVSIQQQLYAEYGFFLSAFDPNYDLYWNMVFTRLYDEGKLWQEDVQQWERNQKLAKEIQNAIDKSFAGLAT